MHGVNGKQRLDIRQKDVSMVVESKSVCTNGNKPQTLSRTNENALTITLICSRHKLHAQTNVEASHCGVAA